MGVNFETNARNLFIVEGLSNGVPRLVKDDDLELGASASPDEPSSSSSFSPPLRRAVCSYKLNPDSSLKGKLDSPQQNQNYGDWNPGSTAKPRRRYRGRFVAANMSFDSPCSLGEYAQSSKPINYRPPINSGANADFRLIFVSVNSRQNFPIQSLTVAIFDQFDPQLFWEREGRLDMINHIFYD